MEGLATALTSLRIDLLIVFGFSWKLPPPVLAIPRLGAINIHVSMLPRYRGPAPLLWAIRNGDATGGVTVHWMDEGFDTGNIIAQQDGIPLADDITWARYCEVAMPAIHSLLRKSVALAATGYPGQPQNDHASSYAGFMENAFSYVDWSKSAHEIHNQVRTHRFMRSHQHPIAKIGDDWMRLIRTVLEPADGLEIACGHGSLWITESEKVAPPSA
jgi:methionyl-tRNA formyltransferase